MPEDAANRVPEDDEATRDHFAALRRARSRPVGLAAWLVAHALALAGAFAVALAFVGVGGLFAFVSAELGFESPDDAEVARDLAPFSLKALAAGLAIGALAGGALWLLLRSMARSVPAMAVDAPSARAARRARRRETRREWQARTRREGRLILAVTGALALVVGSVWLELEWSDSFWEAGLSVGDRVANLIWAALLGVAALAGLVGVAILAWLVALVAGWIRLEFSGRLLPRPPAAAAETSVDAPRRVAAVPVARDAAPTPALLAYLFADRLLPADTAVRLGAPVPCSSAEVKATELAGLVVAVAFWRLRDAGSLRLRETRGRLGRRRLAVERVHEGGGRGIEAAVMRVPNVDPDAYVDEDTSGKPGPLGTVRDVIYAWIGVLDDPEWKVMAEVLDEAEAAGIAARSPGRATRLSIRCEAVAAWEPAFAAFRARWREFGEREPRLRTLLLRECRKGIGGCRAYPDEQSWKVVILHALRWHGRSTRPWPRSTPGRN